MGAATLPEQAAEEGAPVEQDAEATRTSAHLFEYSKYVHAGAGAEECEHREDGLCQEPGHFHAWVCLPNSLQHRDILEKARAAKARRKRALRDAGGDGRPPSDANVMMESDIDDQLAGDIEPVLTDMAERNVRKRMTDLIREVREGDDRFEDYFQDAEEWRRLMTLDEEERPADEFKLLGEQMQAFEDAVQAEIAREIDREKAALRNMSAENFREVLRTARIDAESAEAHLNSYYTWLGFIGTRVVLKPGVAAKLSAKRYFDTLDAFRNASPEAVEAIDEALRDLEGRLGRGEAAGNS